MSHAAAESRRLQPPVKWVGGKTQLLDTLLEYAAPVLRQPGAAYIEPFLGGGAMFLGVREAGFTGPALLNDASPHLSVVWWALANRDTCAAAHATATALAEKHNAKLGSGDAAGARALYEHTRGLLSAEAARVALAGKPGMPVEEIDRIRAAFAGAFLFINRTSYNGLWRVNKGGRSNVPWAKRKATVPPLDKLLEVADALLGAQIQSGDVQGVFTYLRRKVWPSPESPRGPWVFFLDPPYLGTFAGYGTTESRQVARADDASVEWTVGVLARAVEAACVPGDWHNGAAPSRVMMTNVIHPRLVEVVEQMGGAVVPVDEQHNVGATGARRGRRPCALYIVDRD